MAATVDRVPCVYVENQRVVNLDPNDPIAVSYKEHFRRTVGKRTPGDANRFETSHGQDMAIVNGISRIGYMKGGKQALWLDENIADSITHKAVQFIENNMINRSSCIATKRYSCSSRSSSSFHWEKRQGCTWPRHS
jgi:hypothetical protein